MAIKINNANVIVDTGAFIFGSVGSNATSVTQGAPGTSNIFTFYNTSSRTLEATIQITQGANYETVKFIVISEGANAYIEEYARVGSPTNVTISVTVVANLVTVKVTSTTTLADIKGYGFLINA